VRARDNPFRRARVEALAFRDPAITPDALIARWEALGRRGAIVGAHGSGKTTLLAEIAARLAERGERCAALRLSADAPSPARHALTRAIADAGRGGVLLLDGFDLLPAFRRAALRVRLPATQGLIVTAHRPCAWPTLHRTRTSPALLAALTAELLGPGPSPPHGDLEALHARCGGDLRQAFFALYARAADDRPVRGPARDPDATDPFRYDDAADRSATTTRPK
jgi:hypothetical protein